MKIQAYILCLMFIAACGNAGNHYPMEAEQVQGQVVVLAAEMDCAKCAGRIKLAVEKLNGVKSCEASFNNQTITIRYLPDAVSLEQLIAAAKSAAPYLKPRVL